MIMMMMLCNCCSSSCRVKTTTTTVSVSAAIVLATVMIPTATGFLAKEQKQQKQQHKQHHQQESSCPNDSSLLDSNNNHFCTTRMKSAIIPSDKSIQNVTATTTTITTTKLPITISIVVTITMIVLFIIVPLFISRRNVRAVWKRRYNYSRNKRRTNIDNDDDLDDTSNNNDENDNDTDTDTMNDTADDEQEQLAVFEELYTSTIQYSKYSSLVLPPKCYRIPNYHSYKPPPPPVVSTTTTTTSTSTTGTKNNNNVSTTTTTTTTNMASSTAASLVSTSFRLFHSNNNNNHNEKKQQQQQPIHITTEEKEEKVENEYQHQHQNTQQQHHNSQTVGLLYTIPHSPMEHDGITVVVDDDHVSKEQESIDNDENDTIQQQYQQQQQQQHVIPLVPMTISNIDTTERVDNSTTTTRERTSTTIQQHPLQPRTTTIDNELLSTLLLDQHQHQHQQQVAPEPATVVAPAPSTSDDDNNNNVVVVPDQHGYMYIGDEHIHNTKCTSPLLVFVNSRSGSQQGYILIQQLRQLLNPIQIWDLSSSNSNNNDQNNSGCDGGDPYIILESFVPVFVHYKVRILVCGGDGTVAWIIHTLERLMNNINNNNTAKISDGSSSVSSSSSNLLHHSPTIISYPPIAILPLGTGNDLSRILGWGGGYNNESLIVLLEQIAEGYISLLDRWEVTIHEHAGTNITTSNTLMTGTIGSTVKKSKLKQRSVSTSSNSGVVKTKGFFNYLGVGADAQAALQVHNLREIRPQWFFSRIINKAMYGLYGAEDIIKATTVHVRHDIQLIADGMIVPLPHDSQGIILLNIDSYAGGVPLWSHGISPQQQPSTLLSSSLSLSDHNNKVDAIRPNRLCKKRFASENELSKFVNHQPNQHTIDHNMTDEERYKQITACDMPTSCQDGYLDIVSIRGAFHLGQIKVGLSNAQRLCQAREVTIHIRNKVAIQVDGEPWRQNACTIHIRRKPEPAVMLHRSIDDGGVEMEMSKLLDWAEARNIIDHQVHTILMKEFSRRIESKTRERREAGRGSTQRQSNDHFMQITSTIKKAISSGAMFDG